MKKRIVIILIVFVLLGLIIGLLIKCGAPTPSAEKGKVEAKVERVLFEQAATWNRDLVRQAVSVNAYEMRASDIAWNFSPVLGLGRQPAWPRLWEIFGEGVHLTATPGRFMVKGYQGDRLNFDSTRVAACIKHYKIPTQAWIPEGQLQQYFLPPFEEAVTLLKNTDQTLPLDAKGMKYVDPGNEWNLQDGRFAVMIQDLQKSFVLHKS